MTTINRTAYPRPGERLTLEELQVRYDLSDADRAFIESSASSSSGRLILAVMLKTRQVLGYFPALTDIPEAGIAHIVGLLGLSPASVNDVSRPTLYRYRSVIRAHLAVMPFDDAGERLVTDVVLKAAET
ncbi:DUF4158 domain-containing protein, partial [Aurantimonas sp. C2-3-R2]|uniref:DUF4158 domain-containing protein n=1 Tax=Aurantimonas sp. C2-3-R2 TaxID=3114363 RepID=UPI002E178D25|nr:DUF4158 domain-containing protein [Aurantimonas sp. C2-3-R2]